MSDDHATEEKAPKPDKNAGRVHGMMAEFSDVDTLLDACCKVRDAGYTKTDAYTPFPVHHIDKALGIKPTMLPWISLIAGMTGTFTALAMQISMNGDWQIFKDLNFSYSYIISGKPYVSLPAFIPVAFELTILFASFGAFFGMWALNKLPRFSNPMFTDPRFDRVTDDRFFLYIDAKDEIYEEDTVKKLMEDTGSSYIAPVVEDESPAAVPKFIYMIWATVISLSIVPLLLVIKMRVTTDEKPRYHVFLDMDFSPSKDAQQYSSLFADGRAMRPDVPGTVARGQMDTDFRTGIDNQKLSASQANRDEYLVRLLQDEAEAEVDEALEEEDDTSAEDQAAKVPYLTENPLPMTLETLENGKHHFEIYCSVCHGLNGGGNGLVNRRAQKILAATWVPPSNLHDPTLYQGKYPDGKLFSTVTYGIRKMPGYIGQIKPEDRWAIVAYVRALQASRDATIDDVPEAMREDIEAEKGVVDARLAEIAAKEAAAASGSDAVSEDEPSEADETPDDGSGE